MRTTGPRTILAAVTLTVGLPAVAAFALAGRSAPRPVDVPARPALAFDQYLVDLGPVEPTPEVVARFAFANSGAAPIKITKWEPSCGCLKPTLRKTEYLPFESGYFALKVRTAGETPGLHEYRLKVSYEDPQPRETTLTFRVTIPEQQVFVRPRALAIYQNGRQETSHEVTVFDLREPGVTVLATRSSSDLVQAEPLEVTRSPDGERSQKVRITVSADVPKGTNWCTVTLFTDDSRFPELVVPIQVLGPGSRSPLAARETPAKR
jgi:hypothetical protein